METEKYTFEGYDAIRFPFEDRVAEVAFPKTPADGNPWVLKTEYSNAFPRLERELLGRGYARAFLKNHNRWGTHDDLDAKARFAAFLRKEYGFAEKGVIFGQSCGGLHAVKTAAYHPEIASVVVIDAPVIDLLSCPFGKGDPAFRGQATEEVEKALGLTETEMLTYRDHPYDCLPRLIEAGLPLALVYGNADAVVCPAENAELVIRAYRGSRLPFLSVCVAGRGHHPHEVPDFDLLTDFIVSNDR